LFTTAPGQRGWDTVADPTIIDPTDILVRIDTSTICGSDLRILKGDVPWAGALAAALARLRALPITAGP
jgi:threonine dehydrogenase-like Zn-dependent dehydrogenase